MKISKKVLSLLLILVCISAATVVHAGAGHQAILSDFLARESHVILGKTYSFTPEQAKIIEDYLTGPDSKVYSDAQTISAKALVQEAIDMINSTGASSLAEVSPEVKAQALSKVQQAAAKVDVSLNVNTSTGVYTAVADGKTLSSGVINKKSTGSLSVTSSTSNTYALLEGKDQLYNISSCTDLSFRWDVDYSLFENGGKVYIDDNFIDSSCYESKSGSTIITLKYAFLKNVSEGDHIIKVVYNNGTTSTAAFKVTNYVNSGSGSTASVKSGKTFVYTGSDNLGYIALSLLAVVAVSTAFVKKVYDK